MSRLLAQKLSHSHWNRVPDSVLFDAKMSASARCVFACLAGSVHQGTVATVGQRRIALRLGFSRNTVAQGIKELADGGHLVVVAASGQRHRYHLTSDVFGQKQKALDSGAAVSEELVSGPRLATARKSRLLA